MAFDSLSRIGDRLLERVRERQAEGSRVAPRLVTLASIFRVATGLADAEPAPGLPAAMAPQPDGTIRSGSDRKNRKNRKEVDGKPANAFGRDLTEAVFGGDFEPEDEWTLETSRRPNLTW
jgi:hypothetical protein